MEETIAKHEEVETSEVSDLIGSEQNPQGSKYADEMGIDSETSNVADQEHPCDDESLNGVVSEDGDGLEANEVIKEISKEDREENLRIKLQIIEDLKALVHKDEALNNTFNEFRELQEKWRNTGMVPQANLNGLLETFHLHVENFYNYIKINKELRDMDLKHNLQAKERLCEEAEKLIDLHDVALAFKSLQFLHSSWKEIGPVSKEYKDALWDRFKNATTKINDKYHNFFESIKQEQENNLMIKEELCAKAETIASATYNTIHEWNDAGKALVELQNEWKLSGSVPQKERNKIYKKFRAFCDDFFDRKRAFYKTVLTEQEKNLELKIALCEKVEKVKDSTDWKVTTDKIISYQKEWKKIGAAPKKYSNKVWNRFRAACDEFFNRKNEFFSSVDDEQEENLQAKKALIEELKNVELSDNSNDNVALLKSYQSRWAEIGFVPIKYKDSIQEEFRTVINSLFDKLDLDEFDKDLERFKAKISAFDSSDNVDFKIVNEREKIVAKIKQLEMDISTYENNIGFFSKSKKSDNLVKDLRMKIDKTKQRLALYVEKLKMLDDMI